MTTAPTRPPAYRIEHPAPNTEGPQYFASLLDGISVAGAGASPEEATQSLVALLRDVVNERNQTLNYLRTILNGPGDTVPHAARPDHLHAVPGREEKVRACARAAHEANRAYCAALGDHSQAPWEIAPAWQTLSAIKGVEGVLSGNGPRESHESWLEEKRATGWKYGTEKDPTLKTHPCFVPYDELPPAQKMKDGVFVSTVRAMSVALGLHLSKA